MKEEDILEAASIKNTIDALEDRIKRIKSRDREDWVEICFGISNKTEKLRINFSYEPSVLYSKSLADDIFNRILQEYERDLIQYKEWLNKLLNS